MLVSTSPITVMTGHAWLWETVSPMLLMAVKIASAVQETARYTMVISFIPND